ncbi:MAG: FlgD immunoglobulin-like domain containing protein [Candidatus Krumholzibacteriaceae bacterium]|jgi:hypothetical protein
MKHLLLLVASLVALAPAVFADTPIGQIGLYADASHASCCVSGTAMYQVEMYVWAKPTTSIGLSAVEFAIQYPVNVIESTVTVSEDASVYLGNPRDGISMAFEECETDWFWALHQTVFVLNEDLSWAVVVRDPRVSDIIACTCQTGNPIGRLETLTNLCFNFCTTNFKTPFIMNVTKIDAQNLNVVFAEKVVREPATNVSNYTLYDKSTESDTLPVLSATYQADSMSVHLALGASILAKRPYLLEARNILNLQGLQGTSTKGFGDLPDLEFARHGATSIKHPCDNSLVVSYTIENVGRGTAGPFDLDVYWTTDVMALTRDVFLARYHYDGLAPGATIVDEHTYAWPDTSKVVNSVLLNLDAGGSIPESNEGNNFQQTNSIEDYSAHRLRVTDVPGDDGHMVRLYFDTVSFSGLGLSYDPFGQYDIFRRDPGGWTLVGTIPEDGSYRHSINVPTLADSTGQGGAYWSVFKVRTSAKRVMLDNPTTYEYFYSCPDSGCSVNNAGFVATLLKGFSTATKDAAIELTWTLSTFDESDRFAVYRAAEGADFVAIPWAEVSRTGLSFAFVDGGVAGGESYRYRVAYIEAGRAHVLFETESIKAPELPLTLYQNFPNPFNPATTVSYYLPAAGHVRLQVFDASGKLVATLVDSDQQRGSYAAEWKGMNASGAQVRSGVYFCRLATREKTLTHKMVLLR